MKKEKFYTYLGTNGTITSPIFLEGIYHIKKYRLIADVNKVLTYDGRREKRVIVPENEADLWKEVDAELDDLGYNL